MFLSLRNRVAPFLRLSALRQAAILTAIFLVLLAMAGFFSVSQFERVFQNRIEDELRARFAVVATDIQDRGFDPATYPLSSTERITLIDTDRRLRDGFHDDLDFDGDGKRRDRDDDFGRGQWTYLVGPVGQDRLIVGTNLGRRDEFLEIILQSMAMVGLSAAVVALAFGLFLGARTQRRINGITTTLQQAAAGDMAARVRATARRDDLDDLAFQVDDTLSQLDVLIRQTRDFSSNIAHDLKTPLARLRLRLETALSAELDHGDSSDAIGAALEQTDEVIAIFDAFLRIAKLESRTSEHKFTPVALGDLAQQMIDIYEPVVEDSGRVLTLRLDNPDVVAGDQVLLVQMLANMIENAMRHTPTGTQLVVIAQGRTIGLADTGPGIPSEEYDRVIQPLYRLDKSRAQDGAGLGLALVKTIADLHQAELRLSGHPDFADRGLFIRALFPASA